MQCILRRRQRISTRSGNFEDKYVGQPILAAAAFQAAFLTREGLSADGVASIVRVDAPGNHSPHKKRTIVTSTPPSKASQPATAPAYRSAGPLLAPKHPKQLRQRIEEPIHHALFKR